MSASSGIISRIWPINCDTSWLPALSPTCSRIAAAVFINFTILERTKTGPESWSALSSKSSARGTSRTCCHRSRSEIRRSLSGFSCLRIRAISTPRRRATFRKVTPCRWRTSEILWNGLREDCFLFIDNLRRLRFLSLDESSIVACSESASARATSE